MTIRELLLCVGMALVALLIVTLNDKTTTRATQ